MQRVAYLPETESALRQPWFTFQDASWILGQFVWTFRRIDGPEDLPQAVKLSTRGDNFTAFFNDLRKFKVVNSSTRLEELTGASGVLTRLTGNTSW